MMNNLAPRNQAVRRKQQRKQRVSKKFKEPRKTKAKMKQALRLSEGCEENESSEPKKRVHNSASEESVIYVGQYFPEQKKTQDCPMIDLTRSTGSFTGKENQDPKQLKTIYFSAKNFKRHGQLSKFLRTTSLITIPVAKKVQLPPKPSSFTDVSASALIRAKLSVLDIPEKYLEGASSVGSMETIGKVKLDSSDYEMINWIIENSQEKHPLELAETASTSENVYLDTGMSIEELVQVYDVPNVGGFE